MGTERSVQCHHRKNGILLNNIRPMKEKEDLIDEYLDLEDIDYPIDIKDEDFLQNEIQIKNFL